MNTWFCSDHHFGHANIIKFTDRPGGKLIRPFASIEEHDETIIANHNALVSPKDRVYFMGDVAISKKFLHMVGRMNGRKKLIKGNHDIFALKDYTPYFEDIVACRVYPDHDLIVSHIPVHPGQLEHRFKWNAHGHLHINLVTKRAIDEASAHEVHEGCVEVKYKAVPDNRYINLCMEHTGFKPVSMDELLSKMGREKNANQYVHERDGPK